MSKRFLSLILSFMLVLCLAACHSETTPENSEDANVVSQDDSFPGTGEMTSLGSSSAVLDESELEIKTNSQADSSLDTPKTEVKTNSQLNSSTEIVLSSPNSSEILSSNQISSDVLIHDFDGETIEELVNWIKSNQQISLYTSTINHPFLYAVQSQGQLLVPKVVRKDMNSYGITVPNDSGDCVYYFRTYSSEIDYENEIYRIVVSPLTNDDLAKDLTQFRFSNKKSSTATYKDIEYAYLDGYEGTNNSDRIFATAWFIKDDCLISITASWANSFKPWSTDYFDYFDFETITL